MGDERVDERVDHTGDDVVEAGEVGPARRRHGLAGSVLAAALLGFDEALGRKPREEAPVVIDASDDPVDIDADGITVPVDTATSVVAPPQPRSKPTTAPRRRRSSRRR